MLDPSAVSVSYRLIKLQAWLEKKIVIQYLLLFAQISTFYSTHPHYQVWWENIKKKMY